MGYHLHILLCTFQNKVVLRIGGDSYRKRLTSYYSNLKILKLPDLLKLKTAKLVFRHLQNNLPPLISNLFINTSDISVRHTRSSNSFNSPSLYILVLKNDSARLQRCILHQGVKIWNDISSDIKNKTYNFLKRNYKKHLLNQAVPIRRHSSSSSIRFNKDDLNLLVVAHIVYFLIVYHNLILTMGGCLA